MIIFIYLFFSSVPGWYNIRRTNLEHNFPRCNISQLGKQKFLQIYNKYGFFDISFLFFFFHRNYQKFNFIQFLIDIKSRFQNISNRVSRNSSEYSFKTSRLIAVVKKGTCFDPRHHFQPLCSYN